MFRRQHPESEGTQRIEAFSDGVFAIAITLLIIEIGVPHVAEGENLGDLLADEWPSYFAYVLSFIMIGIYWANHNWLFNLFHHTDHWFLMINVLFLMAIAFLPFPTAVLAEYMQNEDERQAAVAFYALGLLLPALGWNALWVYANVRNILVHGLDPKFVRTLHIQFASSIAIYSAAFLLAFVNHWVALAICTGLTAIYVLPPRRPQFIETEGTPG